MFKTALRLGPKIKLVSYSRRRHYNQASEEKIRVAFSKYRQKIGLCASKRYVDSPQILPVSTGLYALHIPMPDLASESITKAPRMTQSTCQLRALRAIDWLYGEQWQAGLLELDETTEL